MSTSKKVIYFTSAFSVISLIFAYLISVNMELHFFTIDSPIISNNFCFAIATGFFASMLIVLVCEIQKYFLSKRGTEDFLYSQYSMIYGELLTMKWLMQIMDQDHTKTVPGQLLVRSMEIIKSQMNAAFSADYTTFCKKNRLQIAHNEFRENNYHNLTIFLNDCRNLEIAVNMDQMNSLKLIGIQSNPTASSYYTGRTIQILLQKIEEHIAYCGSIMEELDESCNKRYHWNERKVLIDSRFSDLSTHDINVFFSDNSKESNKI